MIRIASADAPTRPQPFAFRPAVEALETRYAPAAPTPAGDFYTVRSGRVLTTTNLPPFPNNPTAPLNPRRGVLANDLNVDTNNYLIGLNATLVSGPVDTGTGIAVTTPFSFGTQGQGSFSFRAPRNFNGNVQFQYQAVNAATGEGAPAATVNINVRGPIRRTAYGAGEGGGPRVDVYDSSTTNNLFNFYAYPPEFTGGVRVATGDFNGDGVDDIVTVPGPGGGPVLRIFDGTNGDLLQSFYVFGGQFSGGLTIATADVNGDGQDDIILGAERGGGPRVQVLDGGTFTQLASFFAYPPEFRGGVRVAAGDISGTGTGSESIVTAPGYGGGPVVRRFDLDASNNVTQTSSFFAGDSADTRGLYVAVGDYNGDYTDDIAVGSGAGAAEVRVYSGIDLTQYYSRNFGVTQQLAGLAGLDPSASTPVSSVATGLVNGPGAVPSALPDTGPPAAGGSLTGFTGGARLATSYANRDDNADLIVATGPNAVPEVTIFGGGGGANGLFTSTLADFVLYQSKFYGGIYPTGHQ